MVIGVVAACAVVALGGSILLAARRHRIRSNRRLENLLEEIDVHLKAISTSVAEAIERFAEARKDAPQLFLTLDFDELVETVVAQAAERTGADAAVLRVEGPGGRAMVASLGPQVDSELLERSLGPPDGRPFQSAMTEWTYRASESPADALFHSALVTPLEGSGDLAGALALYSTSTGAFRPSHATAVQALLDEAAIGLTNARRFAEVEGRSLLDPATGVPSPRGYEVELGREITRAHRSGSPLSVVVVGVERAARSGPSAGNSNGVADVARLLTRVTRKSDISCKRGDREFAIVLPETRVAGATTLTNRLREEAKRTLGVGRSTLTLGFVEWRPDETVEALDARLQEALAPSVTALPRKNVEAAPEPVSDLRRDALEAVVRAIVDAQRLDHPVALAVLDVDGLGDIAERRGAATADSVLGEVARRLDESVGAGSVHRLGDDEFALVLPASTANDAEALLGALQATLEPPTEVERITLCAGITELAEGERATAVLGRAEQALRQAKQVGPGTVVVAVPGSTFSRDR
jgi:diguanylate cyclase (GGDEF)-like protein